MKKCVLIYDDDQEILLLCKAILSKEYHVETLFRCENVINDITLLKPAIILMDLWIPETGGEKAIAEIKKNEATKHIPVILFSANADIAVICKKINANGYIEKPFDIITFQDVIKQNIK
jgi:DNA-binding NtrC family response regulator